MGLRTDGPPTWKRGAQTCPNCGAVTCRIVAPVVGRQLVGGRGVARYDGCPACPWASAAQYISERAERGAFVSKAKSPKAAAVETVAAECLKLVETARDKNEAERSLRALLASDAVLERLAERLDGIGKKAP